MVYDQAAADWQARAGRAEAELARLRGAAEPGVYELVPGERWRTGTSPGTDGLTLYRHLPGGPERGRLVGMMRAPEDAALVVDAVNAQTGRRPVAPEGWFPDRMRRVATWLRQDDRRQMEALIVQAERLLAGDEPVTAGPAEEVPTDG